MEINTANLERDILAVIAGKIGAKIDVDIFRTAIPENVQFGASVSIASFQPVMFDNFSFPRAGISFVAKYGTFDEATQMANRIGNSLPLYGVASGSHRLNFIAGSSAPNVEWVTDAGAQKYAVYWSFTVEIMEVTK